MVRAKNKPGGAAGFGRELSEPSTKGRSGVWSTKKKEKRSEVSFFQLTNENNTCNTHRTTIIAQK